MSATVLESDLVISYEGSGDVTELMGGTQANFLVRRPGNAAKEVAVILNLQASAALAKELGGEDDEHFRENAARIVGRLAIEHSFERFHRLDSLLFVSSASLKEDPELIEETKRLIASATAMATPTLDRMAPQH